MLLFSLHEDLIRYFKEYIIVGGMQAVVKSWIEQQSLQAVSRSNPYF